MRQLQRGGMPLFICQLLKRWRRRRCRCRRSGLPAAAAPSGTRPGRKQRSGQRWTPSQAPPPAPLPAARWPALPPPRPAAGAPGPPAAPAGRCRMEAIPRRLVSASHAQQHRDSTAASTPVTQLASRRNISAITGAAHSNMAGSPGCPGCAGSSAAAPPPAPSCSRTAAHVKGV